MKDRKGAVTLEACVSVLSFLILMLMLSSLFVMFMAQNTTAHALLQTAESLSLDVYSIEKMGIGDGEISGIGDIIAAKLYGSADDNPYYMSDDRWYLGDNEQVAEAVQKRFIGYLAGGDEEQADALLKQMNVAKGLKGMDFSESHVTNGTLYVVLRYELEYDFNIWNVKVEQVEQEACAKLWK